MVWQAADMMYENEELDFAVPEEGSNLWFDNMVIPKTSKILMVPTPLLTSC